MSKLKTFYGIRTTDDERHSSFKAYAETRELAVEELKNHCDWFASNPPKPDKFHIVPMQMLVEEDDNKNKEFVLKRISARIFIIVTKNQLDESCTMWLKSPAIVHGFIFIHGDCYDAPYIEAENVSNEVTSTEFERLCLLAQDIVFNL